LTLGLKYVHVHSMRLQTGQEALVARVLSADDKAGFGFSFRLDAAEARRMAEWDAGTSVQRPTYEPVLGHPWETAFVAGQPVPWDYEPGFTALEFLPPLPPASSASTR
jgi:hypothetical protein